MTITVEDYIDRVLDWLPRGMPDRHHIVTELRGHIAERLAGGQPLDQVLRQLGDPLTLAESYTSAVPLVSASFGQRALAKIVDVALVCAFLVPVIFAVVWFTTDEARLFLGLPLIFGASMLAGLYLIGTEATYGRTLGKHLMSLRVVRESGARISFGQAVVRQLPMFMQMYWVDVLFALFTEKSQRAFELLSKTRVVQHR